MKGAMKYSEIKTMEELEKAQKNIRKRIDRKGDAVRESLYEVKDSFTPVNLVATGLKSVSSVVPFDRMLLTVVSALKQRLSK